ncbi:MAG TPA: hypothetical protein VFZ42_06440 [Chitinophagaceae bacterium]
MKIKVMGIGRNPAKLIFMPSFLNNNSNRYVIVKLSRSEDTKIRLTF